MTRRWFVIGGVAALLALLLNGGQASATHGNDVRRILDSYWDISYYQMTTTGLSAVNNARSDDIDPLPYLQTRTSSAAASDISVADDHYGEGWYANYECQAYAGQQKFDILDRVS